MSVHTLLPRLLLLAAVPMWGTQAPETGTLAPEPSSALVGSRVERFVLEWRGEDPIPLGPGARVRDAGRAGVIGLASMRRSSDGSDLQLELELEYLAERLRLLSVESLDEGGSRLIWREMAPGRGRTVRAEWSIDGVNLDTAEWDGGARRSRTASLEEGGVLPQYLLELARTGSVLSGTFRVFDPLGGGLESQELTTTYETGVEEHLERVVWLRRADGTLAGEYHFQNDVLVGFRLQNGRVVARLVSEEVYLDARDLYHAGAAAGTKAQEGASAGTDSSSGASER